MIQLYTGVPGSGKTYKMVSDLDAFLQTEGSEDVYLLTNIHGLKLQHLDFEDFVRESLGDMPGGFSPKLEKFFSYEYQSELTQKLEGPLFYVLDECQLYFPRRASMPNTEEYLQRHRHLGHNIYLASQSSKLINTRIVPLIEMEYSAVRRSISFFGEMRYRVKSPQSEQLVKTITIYPKKRVFELYKSFDSAEIRKPQRQLLRRILPLLIMLPIAAYFFYQRAFNVEARNARFVGSSSSTISSEPGVQNQVAGSAVQALRQEHNKEVSELKGKLKTFEEKLAVKERYILEVIKVGERRLTVDPDTLSVVEIEKIKHKVSCVADGLRCYFDRAPDEAVRFAASADSVHVQQTENRQSPFLSPIPGDITGISIKPGPARPNRQNQTLPQSQGSGSFVTEDLVTGYADGN